MALAGRPLRNSGYHVRATVSTDQDCRSHILLPIVPASGATAPHPFDASPHLNRYEEFASPRSPQPRFKNRSRLPRIDSLDSRLSLEFQATGR